MCARKRIEMHENCLMGLCDWIILCTFAVRFGTLFWTKTSGLFIQSIGFQRVIHYALRDYLPLKQGLRHYEEELRKWIDESKTPEERQFYTFLLNSMVIGGL